MGGAIKMIECMYCDGEIVGYKRNNENEVEVVECPHCEAVYYAIVERKIEPKNLEICDY
jgi:NAD-dependent SIR2 family protein deacetylase